MCQVRPFKAASESGRGVSVSTLVYGPTGLATLWRVMVQQQQQQWTVAKPVGLERESVWVEAGRGRWNPTSSSLFNSIQGRMEVTLTRWRLSLAVRLYDGLSPRPKTETSKSRSCMWREGGKAVWRLFNQRSHLSNTRLSWKWPPHPQKRKISGCLWQAPAHSHPQWTAR